VKGRDWERLARHEIVPALGSAYAVEGSLIYRRPIEHVLLGVNVDTVYVASRLHVKAVVMPLYSPRGHLTYFVPRDLGAIDVLDKTRLPSGALELFTAAVPFLEQHATPELLLRDESWKRADDSVRLEVEGYSYLLVGDGGSARQILEHATTLPTDPELEWLGEIQRRCRLVLSLMQGGLDRACAQLVEWEDETLAALRLSRE
jgi:hypothetical protein